MAASAQDWPQHAGDQYNAIRTPLNVTPWTVTINVLPSQSFGGKDYFPYTVTNWNNTGATSPQGLFRSQGAQLYQYDQGTNVEQLWGQFASKGTRWSFLEQSTPPYQYEVIEIVSVGPLTTPFGTFQQAYKHKHFLAVNPNNLSLGTSPEWNIWIAEGVGFIVQQEDWWVTSPPELVSLSGVNITPGTGYCFGDGTGTVCPCSGAGNLGEGCANTSGLGGATLTGAGNASITADTFQLAVHGVPGSKPGLLLRGSTQLAGSPVGDGLLCTSGSAARSQVQVTTAGSTTFTNFQGSPFSLSSHGAGVATNYQFWYRDSSNPCSGAGFNFSNAWTTTWLP